MTDQEIEYSSLCRPWPPPVPAMPCFKCGVVTTETQSIFGVGHYQCFMGANVRHNVKIRGEKND